MAGEAHPRCEYLCLHPGADSATRAELDDLLAVAAALCDATVGLAIRAGDRAVVGSFGATAESVASLVAAVAELDPADPRPLPLAGGALRLVGAAPLVASGGGVVGGLWVFGAGEAIADGGRRDALRRIGRIVAGLARARDTRGLQGREALLRGAINGAPMVVFLLDGEGRFTLSEGGGLGNLGLAPGQVVGASAYEMYAPFPTIVENLRIAVAGGDAEWTIAKWEGADHDCVRGADTVN